MTNRSFRSDSRGGASRAVLAVLVAVSLVTLMGSTAAGGASKKKTIQILVTNDDGYAHQGIDTLVEALRKLPRVKVTVSAPATNQTGEGVPGFAVSVGLLEGLDQAAALDYDEAARQTVKWLKKHRKQIEAGRIKPFDSLTMSVPSCATGRVRGVLELPLAVSPEHAVAPANCESTLEDPADDITGFNNGFVVISAVQPAP